jgi:hypothetical protein
MKHVQLNSKPYIALLVVYWVLCLMHCACSRSGQFRIVSTALLCVLALVDCGARFVLWAVPVIWLWPGRHSA